MVTLHNWLIGSLCIIVSISHLGVEGKTLVLIAPIPGHRTPFYFYVRFNNLLLSYPIYMI